MQAASLVAAASVIGFGSFAWGVQRHFRRGDAMPRRMRWLSCASLLALLWFLLRIVRDGVAGAWPIALTLMLAASALFWAAIGATRARRPTLAFDDDVPAFLYQHGPYRLIRHPFYSAYIVFWIATSLATPGLISWLVPIVFGLVYIDAARREERKFASSALSAQYHLYRERTGMMWPRVSPPTQGRAIHRR